MSSPQSVELGKVGNFSYANTIDQDNTNTNITIADSPCENMTEKIANKSISSSKYTCQIEKRNTNCSSTKNRCASYLKYTIFTLAFTVAILFILSISGIIHVDEVFPLSTFKQEDDKIAHESYMQQNSKKQKNEFASTEENTYEGNNISVYSPKTVNVNNGQVYESEQSRKGSSMNYKTMNENNLEVNSTFVPLSTWSHRRFLEHSPEGWQYDDSIQMLRKIDKHFQDSYNHYSNQGEVLVPVSCSIPVPLYERNKNFQEKGHPVAKDYRGAPATNQQLYSAMERDAVKYRQYLTATGKHVGSWLEPATDIGNYRRLFVDTDEDERFDRNKEQRFRKHGDKHYHEDQDTFKSTLFSRKQEIEMDPSSEMKFQNDQEQRRKEIQDAHHARHLLVGEGYYFEEDGKPYFMYKDTTYFIQPSPTGPNPWPEGVQPVDAIGDDGYFWIYREMGEQAAFMQCFLKIEAVKYGPYFQEFMRFGTFQTPFYDY